MADLVSPSLYIDFSRLPPPDVIETVEYEALLARYKASVLARKPELDQALKLEQSPANVVLEVEAYGEMLVRARINSAARAVMLPFAKGADLDVLAAFFGVSRMTSETDEQLRRRAQLAPEAFSTAGSQGAYIFQALSSDVSIRDVTAIRTDDHGGVKVTVMNSGSDPLPTTQQLANVRARLHASNVKPLTDVVTVAAPTVHRTAIRAVVTLYPGPDGALVLKDIATAVARVRDRISILGRNLERAAVISALYQEGVENVRLTEPAQDIPVPEDACVQITAVEIGVDPVRVS